MREIRNKYDLCQFVSYILKKKEILCLLKEDFILQMLQYGRPNLHNRKQDLPNLLERTC